MSVALAEPIVVDKDESVESGDRHVAGGPCADARGCERRTLPDSSALQQSPTQDPDSNAYSQGDLPMRRFVTMSILTLAAGLILSAAAPAQETLTYPDLVQRLTDLEHLAVLPAKGETCKQWSSYDRASKYDEATGKYVALGRQRRRRRHHPPRRRAGGDGRDGRPGLHLADLVGRWPRRAT